MLNHSDSTHPLDATFKALADSSRRTMLMQLTRGPQSVAELARPLAMSLPAVMQHLGVLEQAGLVTTEKVGRVRTCRIAPEAFGEAQQWLSARRAEWEARFDRLGDYLETMKKETAPDGHRK
ncbi:helix-turn-helix transcriptional regulator [Cupriavidus sp. SW-Y-13]|uniref:ArsR/SmtB family transcription factor n=1 Tax=Cupriavidus sp. SW-Y-13 TaxID=2653854 RepID=UPI001366771E|nr:metalloregulator ArsR/SmtB family transcription factor [Cupriavidus sp. SW-Y-13]MWL87284.1 metalloregulator ArsR/SmtB family transcription factor [Cupriavidus sp. SW-Y-13]